MLELSITYGQKEYINSCEYILSYSRISLPWHTLYAELSFVLIARDDALDWSLSNFDQLALVSSKIHITRITLTFLNICSFMYTENQMYVATDIAIMCANKNANAKNNIKSDMPYQ